MHLQVDSETRQFRSPVFAAFYANRLRELRGRISYLCSDAWDINSAWLLHSDIDELARQTTEFEPNFDISPMQSLSDALNGVFEQASIPATSVRQKLLALFQQLDTEASLPDLRLASVHHTENDRIETPPAQFWLNWVESAPPPTYTEASQEDVSEDNGDTEHLENLSQIDVSALLNFGQSSSETRITQERIAPESNSPTKSPSAHALNALEDDFFDSDFSNNSTNSDDYDWEISDTPSTARRDNSLDAFWEATRSSQPTLEQTPVAIEDDFIDDLPPLETSVQAEISLEERLAKEFLSTPLHSEQADDLHVFVEAPQTTDISFIDTPNDESDPWDISPRNEDASGVISASSDIDEAVTCARKEPVLEPTREDSNNWQKEALNNTELSPSDDRTSKALVSPTPMASASRTTQGPAILTVDVSTHPLTPQLTPGDGKRIYHLTESGDLACELDQRLEQLNYELELLDSAQELREVLGALTPNIVIVDAEFEDALESIGEVLRIARLKASKPIHLLALCHQDTMKTRLAARRAGADALMFGAETAEQVIAQIEKMLHVQSDDRYRVLIVEDDRAQGLFAESILRNAGMEVEVIEDGMKVMDALHRFQPDLILMDLHMPDCNGTELTALIRERDEFLHTPIVFLSGEVDEDKHFEALSAGGDDFLSKPIRPKYLIASVNNRVRRARSMRQRAAQPARTEPFDSGTGLHFRAAMQERLEQSLVENEPHQRNGGLIFIGVENIPTLRERLGLTTVEELLEDVAQFVVSQLGSGTMACRYGDACFLVFDASADPTQLMTNTNQLRDSIALHRFDTPRESISLEITVGLCDLRQPFADAAAVINFAEHNARPPQRLMTMESAPAPSPESPQGTFLQHFLASDDALTHLDLDYQPVVALQGGEQAQYQCLLRLRHPNGETFTAGQLLSVIRQQGRLPQFDRWVLSRALDVAGTRLAMAKPVTLFVNQTVETLRTPDYAEWIKSKLLGLSQLGESLILEIDGDEIGLDLEAVHSLCTQLMPFGVRFCLGRYRGSEDQDGMLHVLPVDLVKIAPDLISQLSKTDNRDNFSALVERMHERGLGVIAPRVEDTRTAAVLWMSGIDFIQGNLVQLAGTTLDFDFESPVL